MEMGRDVIEGILMVLQKNLKISEERYKFIIDKLAEGFNYEDIRSFLKQFRKNECFLVGFLVGIDTGWKQGILDRALMDMGMKEVEEEKEEEEVKYIG